MELVEILKTAVEAGSSDIHLVIGKPPLMRVNGEMTEIPGFAKIMPDESKRLIYSILYEEQRAKFEETWELDCSFAVTGLSRFRVNVFLQKNGVEAVMRVINSKIPTAEQLRLQKSVTDLADLPRGLVLVTGPTGSGKSTTLAVLMELINNKYSDNILTVEDPIEFVYESKKSIFRQARSRPKYEVFRGRPEVRPSPGPRRHPHRRAARPGNHTTRDHRRGNRPPVLRHPAHAGRAVDDRPHHRRVPAAPAGPGPRPARRCARRPSSASSSC